METRPEFFFRLPFILYPEKIPKNMYDAVEKASIALYAHDEIKKNSFLKKGEKVRAINKIFVPFLLYRNEARGLVFSNLIDFKNIGIHNFPANIPVLPEDLNSSSFNDFVKSLNEIYLILNNLEGKTEFLDNYPTIKLILDLEYLLHYPGMNQALVSDHTVFGLDKKPNQIEMGETIKKYKKMNSFLLSLQNYLHDYPTKKIDNSKSQVNLLLDQLKREIYQKYEDLIYKLRKVIETKIEELELKRSQEIDQIHEEFNNKQDSILKSICPKLNKSAISLKSVEFEQYSKENNPSPDEYIANIKKNHGEHQKLWKKHEEHLQNVLMLYDNSIEEEQKLIEEMNIKYDSKILSESQKIVEKEKERDNKISELEVQETILDNQVKNIKTMFNSKSIEIELILQKIKSMTINLTDHPLKDRFQNQNYNILGLPFYIIHIESLEKPIQLRFKVIAPVIFPENQIKFTQNFQIYGNNPDFTSGYIAFNNVSDHFANIAHNLLTNITFHTKIGLNPPSELVLTKEETNKLLNGDNLLLDPFFETGVYNGLDWLDSQRNILRKKIETKSRNAIIHFFDDLNNLILKQKK